LVRVFARVLLAPPSVDHSPPLGPQRHTVMGWRTLLTLPAAGAEETVTIGATTTR